MDGTGFAPLLALQHEHRADQVVHRQAGLAHQAAGEIVPAQAAHAGGGVLGGCGQFHGVVRGKRNWDCPAIRQPLPYGHPRVSIG
jgi:hypothetical protein